MMAEPPPNLILETVCGCNSRCVGCPLANGLVGDRGMMHPDLFDKVMLQAQQWAKHVYLHCWGEPLLHPDLSHFIKLSHEYGMTVDLATNGILVTEVNAPILGTVQDLSVTISAIDEETYYKYHPGGDFAKAWNGLRLLRDHAKHGLNWTFIVWAWNEHQVDAGKKMAEELGVRFGAKKPYLLPETPVSWIPSARWLRRPPAIKRCQDLTKVMYVYADGTVTPCCYDYGAEWVLGNAWETELLEIWNGPAYAAARTLQKIGRFPPFCRKGCMMP